MVPETRAGCPRVSGYACDVILGDRRGASETDDAATRARGEGADARALLLDARTIRYFRRFCRLRAIRCVFAKDEGCEARATNARARDARRCG